MTAAGKAPPGRIALPRWAWWLMMALPAAFIAIGMVIAADTARFLWQAERAEAVVVSVEAVGGQGYRPTLRYQAPDGTAREAVTHVADPAYGFAAGTRLDIFHDPAQPGVVRIADDFALWGLPLVLMALGGLFLQVVRVVRRRLGGA